jgi:hypothetical protein
MENNTARLEVEKILKEHNGNFLGLNKIGLLLQPEVLEYLKKRRIKLKHFIEEHSDIFEISSDENGLPIVRLSLEHSLLTRTSSSNISSKSSDTHMEQITSFAHIPASAEEDLRSLILRESWGYIDEAKESALMKYLRYTFLKVSREEQVLKAKEYACFDTGLVDKLYRNVYMVFTKNRNPGMQPFYYAGFCVAGAKGLGKRIVELFNPLPQAAHYFNNPSDLLYYPVNEPSVDWEHIIVDNVARLPQEFLSEELRIDVDKLPDSGGLQDRLKSDHFTLRRITARLKESLEVALKRTRWNYKTAIPMYYPAKDKLTLLLPLSLMNEEKVDVALVVERMANGNFLGHTILSLKDAYSNARLIARPDSDWLIIN